MLYLPLSAVLGNDVLCYNLIWFASIVFTGLGTFALAWHVARDRRCAFVGGVLAMLSGPMLLFARNELEQVTLGVFPAVPAGLAALGWMTHAAGAGGGGGGTCCWRWSSAVYGVFGVFPAALYVASRWARPGRRGPALDPSRLPWFAAFVALVVPALLALFAGQVWAAAHGYPMARDLPGSCSPGPRSRRT